MDFAQPLICVEGVASRSGICLVQTLEKNDSSPPPPSSTTEAATEATTASTTTTSPSSKLNDLLVKAANDAAVELFLGSYRSVRTKKEITSQEVENDAASDLNEKEASLVNSKLYPECILPSNDDKSLIIHPGSLVVLFESFDSLNFVYATPGEIFSNRNGHFHHDDFIHRPFGSKVRSKSGLGFLHLLRPTPELWTKSLIHRTQIVHELDASMITFQLDVRPNDVVCESGTGSGAMSHALLRAICPHGTLHTYEFNRHRVDTARDEFRRNGVDHLVHVHWRDVCGLPLQSSNSTNQTEVVKSNSTNQTEVAKSNSGDAGDADAVMGVGGFDLPPNSVDAIFLDLPSPWHAIEHAAYVLKMDGRIGSYSPCIEQVQKTVKALQEHGFHSIRTMEVRLREHYVDDVELDSPPSAKLIPLMSTTTTTTAATATATAATMTAAATTTTATTTTETTTTTATTTTVASMDMPNTTSKEMPSKKRLREDISEIMESQRTNEDLKQINSEDENMAEPSLVTQQNKQNVVLKPPNKEPTKKKTMFCARPFPSMRGHTAFLTFASASVKL